MPDRSHLVLYLLDAPARGLRRLFNFGTWERFGQALPETKSLIDQNAWPLLGVLLVAGAVGLLWWGPKWYVSHSAAGLPLDPFKAEQDARATLLQAIGGLVVLVTLYRGWREFHQSQRERSQDPRHRTEELALTRQNSVAERFSRAIEQLGSQNKDVRLGSILSLEILARDNPEYHWPTLDVLAAYIQEHTRDNYEAAEALVSSGWTQDGFPALPNDIYFALNALTNRDTANDGLANSYIDLSLVCLCHAPVAAGADLSWCDFSHAHLEHAVFRGTRLANARFENAWLMGCDFEGAELAGAVFDGARLEDAWLDKATGLTAAQLSAAASIDRAQLPAHLKSEST